MIVSDRWFSYDTFRGSRSEMSSGRRFGKRNEGNSPTQYSDVPSLMLIVTSADGAVLFCASTTPQTASRNMSVAAFAFVFGAILALILQAPWACCHKFLFCTERWLNVELMPQSADAQGAPGGFFREFAQPFSRRTKGKGPSTVQRFQEQ